MALSFNLPASNVLLLHSPPTFHKTLLNLIENARSRILISSLYIGSNQTSLVNALHLALDSNPQLRLHLALDLNRATRISDSSVSLILPLLKAYPSRVKLLVYRPPSLLASLVPARFNEGFGTWHPKIYAVDDTLLVSGANLNQSYFTTRQDRYLLINDARPVVDWCEKFLNAVGGFSYTVALKGERSKASKHDILRHDYDLLWNGGRTNPYAIRFKAREALLGLTTSTSAHSPLPPAPNQVNVRPLIQAGMFGVRQEETFVKRLLAAVPETNATTRPVIHLTTGYFNLHAPYQRALLLNRCAEFNLLVASPKANGFFGSSGLSGRIPEAYTLLERRFVDATERLKRSVDVRLVEWTKPDWTYHAKGIWVSASKHELPTMTLFGSTNLSERSAERDLELSFALSVPEQNTTSGESKEHRDVTALRHRLADEIAHLWSNGLVWKGREETEERKVRRGTPFLAWLVGGML